MSKIGRNESCPCGSGKKYKKCCQSQSSPPSAPRWIAVEDAIDRESNLVIDLINEGRLVEAEQAAKKFHLKYPDDIDGPDRLAMVYEARHEDALAIEWYQRALDHALNNPGFGEGIIQDYRESIAKLKKSMAP